MKKLVTIAAIILTASPVCLAQNASPNYPNQNSWHSQRTAPYDAATQGWTPPPGWTPPGSASQPALPEGQRYSTGNNFRTMPQTFTRSPGNHYPTAPGFNVNKVQYAQQAQVPAPPPSNGPTAPAPGNDLVGYLKSDFPLPPGKDEAEQFSIPPFINAALGGMKKRAFRMM